MCLLSINQKNLLEAITRKYWFCLAQKWLLLYSFFPCKGFPITLKLTTYKLKCKFQEKIFYLPCILPGWHKNPFLNIYFFPFQITVLRNIAFQRHHEPLHCIWRWIFKYVTWITQKMLFLSTYDKWHLILTQMALLNLDIQRHTSRFLHFLSHVRERSE